MISKFKTARFAAPIDPFLDRICFVRPSRELLNIHCRANIGSRLGPGAKCSGVDSCSFVSREAGKPTCDRQPP